MQEAINIAEKVDTETTEVEEMINENIGAGNAAIEEINEVKAMNKEINVVEKEAVEEIVKEKYKNEGNTVYYAPSERKSNMEFQLADHDNGNFIMLNREMFEPNQNNEYLLSLEEKGLLTTLLNFQGLEWKLTMTGLAKVCNCTTSRVIRILDSLEEKGYFERLGEKRDNRNRIKGYVYKVYETVNKDLWSKMDQNIINEYNLYKKESKKQKRKSKILSLIHNEIENEKLREVLIKYFDFYISSGKPIQIQNYRAMMEKLDALSRGIVENKIAIVERSLQKSWLDFYDLDTLSLTKISQTTQKISDDMPPEYYQEDAVDEKGNYYEI